MITPRLRSEVIAVRGGMHLGNEIPECVNCHGFIQTFRAATSLAAQREELSIIRPHSFRTDFDLRTLSAQPHKPAQPFSADSCPEMHESRCATVIKTV
jgi:hypothetical protein